MEPLLSCSKWLLEDINGQDQSKWKMLYSIESAPVQSTMSGLACHATLLRLTKAAQHTHDTTQ